MSVFVLMIELQVEKNILWIPIIILHQFEQMNDGKYN